MKRIVEFFRVFWIENGILRLPYLLLGIFQILPYITCKKADDVREWKRRYRICLKCPIYDAKLKRCRPYDGSDEGCGCYVPFSNLVYETCWGRLNYGKKIGWSKFDKESWIKSIR